MRKIAVGALMFVLLMAGVVSVSKKGVECYVKTVSLTSIASFLLPPVGAMMAAHYISLALQGKPLCEQLGLRRGLGGT